MTPLDPRFVPLQREVGVYATVALSFAALLALTLALGPRRWFLIVPIWTLVSIALAAYSYLWPPLEYRHMGYDLSEEGIEIRSGVVWRAISNVPRARVQHTDVTQGPLERKHGLGRLVIYTAGTAHSRVELPGLEHATALAIRDQLLPREAPDAV